MKKEISKEKFNQNPPQTDEEKVDNLRAYLAGADSRCQPSGEDMTALALDFGRNAELEIKRKNNLNLYNKILSIHEKMSALEALKAQIREINVTVGDRIDIAKPLVDALKPYGVLEIMITVHSYPSEFYVCNQVSLRFDFEITLEDQQFCVKEEVYDWPGQEQGSDTEVVLYIVCEGDDLQYILPKYVGERPQAMSPDEVSSTYARLYATLEFLRGSGHLRGGLYRYHHLDGILTETRYDV